MEIKKNKVLLICPEFYDYRQKIEKILRSKSYHVTSIKERPRRWVYSFIKRALPSRLKVLFYNFYFCNYLSVSAQQYDLVICIRGEVVSEKFLQTLRKNNSAIKMIMYQWDSQKVNDFSRLLKYFDIIKSFDIEDCERLDIEYLPLFYSEDYLLVEDINNDVNFNYDICYVGSFNNERYKALSAIKLKAEQMNLSYKFHLYISFIDFIKLKLFSKNKVSINDVEFHILSRGDIFKIISRSRAILDIENILQTGFTMRTFEALASGRLLLTTNKNITNGLDVKQNIFFLDRNNIGFPNKLNEFLPRKPEGIEQYSMSKWINSLLKGC